MDDSGIKRAKHYAKQTAKSLSVLIEQYLVQLTDKKDYENLSPGLKKIVGSVTISEDFDEEESLRNYMENKHL